MFLSIIYSYSLLYNNLLYNLKLLALKCNFKIVKLVKGVIKGVLKVVLKLVKGAFAVVLK